MSTFTLKKVDIVLHEYGKNTKPYLSITEKTYAGQRDKFLGVMRNDDMTSVDGKNVITVFCDDGKENEEVQRVLEKEITLLGDKIKENEAQIQKYKDTIGYCSEILDTL